MRKELAAALCAAFTAAGCGSMAGAQDKGMGFFLASNQDRGGNLGGLAGADARCQALAGAAGAGDRTWRAYLSTSDGTNARDRIGRGPWRNAKGVVVAKSVEDLHANPNIGYQTALTEKGEPVNKRGMKPNMHDILTGSQADGRAFPRAKGDTTCRDWTSASEGSAFVGHHDREGLDQSAAAKSWNSSHPTKGCSQEGLRSTGGNGYFYCFAAD